MLQQGFWCSFVTIAFMCGVAVVISTGRSAVNSSLEEQQQQIIVALRCEQWLLLHGLFSCPCLENCFVV